MEAEEIDWADFRMCRVCRVPIGAACLVRSGKIVAGYPDGAVQLLDRPHTLRKRRKGR